jgi:hypothetical protein
MISIDTCISHKINLFIFIVKTMEEDRYLSGAQDLYLSPGCLKLFSFSIMHCINQQIQCELQNKSFHVSSSNHLLNL